MIVYLTTNLITNKKYLGKDSNNNPNYLGSGINIKNAIKKYGKENFKKEIIEVCKNKNHLVKREEYWLNKFDVENNKEFYNKTNKAFGNSGHTVKSKLNISKGLRKRKWKKEWNKKISKARRGIKHKNHPKGKFHKSYGKPKSAQHSINIGKGHKK
jgi:hypothetical protein